MVLCPLQKSTGGRRTVLDTTNLTDFQTTVQETINSLMEGCSCKKSYNVVAERIAINVALGANTKGALNSQLPQTLVIVYMYNSKNR